MSAFTQIDLARLPAPQVVVVPDYEATLAEMKAALIAQAPQLAAVLELESEPALKVLQVCAYYVMLSRAEKNDAARAVMLPYATGSDLDNLGALMGVARAIIDPGDPMANPARPAVLEADSRYRTRIQLSLEGFSTAGPVGAYIFHALTASPEVLDVYVASPAPAEVEVSVLAVSGDGAAPPSLISLVEQALNDTDTRPVADRVSVQPATIIPYQIAAELRLQSGPDPDVVLAEVEKSVADFVARHRMLGAGVPRSGLFAALHQPGVAQVALTAPAADLQIAGTASAFCTAINIAQVTS